MLASATGGLAYLIYEREKATEVETERVKAEAEAPPPVAEEPIATALQIDNVRLELGYGLLSLINNPRERRLTDQIKGLRRQPGIEEGFGMPSVRNQDNPKLPPNPYHIRHQETEAG